LVSERDIRLREYRIQRHSVLLIYQARQHLGGVGVPLRVWRPIKHGRSLTIEPPILGSIFRALLKDWSACKASIPHIGAIGVAGIVHGLQFV